MPPALPNPSALTEAVVSGDRAALARAITLAESTRADHQAVAREVLAEVLPRTGGAIRVGVTGVPGAGKSTLLDALGGRLIDAGHRVAVLAVDPSSARSGGSILGDKTRMERLAVDPSAFVRPSPTAGTLGGVARRTREALLLCEAAGYDVVFVETVGVGQSETAVAAMTDVFLLLVLAQGGDELQGIKRGIMELADVVTVHKSDLGADAAREAVRRYRSALHLFPPAPSGWTPQVLAASSRTGEGQDDLWALVRECFDHQKVSGYLERNRAAQREAHLDETIRAALVERFAASPAVQAARADVEADVRAGRVTPEDGAARLLAVFAQP
ncbi:MAG: methylmalonyl Co-A mutase-associated GTPase MeaB [Bacteroidetes bacterium]|nr:methylmalonyl Co-A mutase-associated GTPase MeaB [Bacteroidota bacterium]